MTLDLVMRWRGLDPVTLEHCHVQDDGGDRRICGTIITPTYGLFYRIVLDPAGRVATAHLERTDGKTLELLADGAGNWSETGVGPRPDLQGCVDIDIWPTPLTNSLPIWRSSWDQQAEQSFSMSWIDGDHMTVRRDEQIYTRLDATRFRFRNAAGTFERVLELDAEGLVVNYPLLFERI